MIQTPNLSFRLSVEELAVALGVNGNPAVSKLLLVSTFGEIAPQEEQGRLLAAGHSLMARGLLSLIDGQPRLAQELIMLLGRTSEYEFAIRLDRKTGADEATDTFFVRREEVLAQTIEQGVVYSFTETANKDSIITEGLRLFGIENVSTSAYDSALVSFEALERARESVDEPLEKVTRILVDSGVPSSLATSLADSFKSQVIRGSAMRVEKRGEALVANEGFLTLVSTSKSWLFPISVIDGNKFVRPIEASPDLFVQEMKTLMHN